MDYEIDVFIHKSLLLAIISKSRISDNRGKNVNTHLKIHNLKSTTHKLKLHFNTNHDVSSYSFSLLILILFFFFFEAIAKKTS